MFVDPDGMKARDYPVLEWNAGVSENSFMNLNGYNNHEFIGRAGGGGGLASANMYGNINGGGYTGSGLTFGQTQAYRDLMSAYWSGNTGGMTNRNGVLSWWTDESSTSIGHYWMLKLKDGGGSNWYGPGGQANWAFGAAAAFSGVKGALNAERMYAQGIRGGLSGNYALTGRNLSQFGKMAATDASMPISSLAKWGGFAGKVSFGIGVAMDGIGVYNYYYNPDSKNKVHPAKAGLNTTIGAYGLTGAGTIPALLYFGVDAFYPENQNGHTGWEAYGEAYESLQSQNAAIIRGFITAPYGSQKF